MKDTAQSAPVHSLCEQFGLKRKKPVFEERGCQVEAVETTCLLTLPFETELNVDGVFAINEK